MKSIAIIGASLAGLGAAYHLSSAFSVSLFDAGAPLSVPAALLHPYPGEQGRRSHLASEGMESTRELLCVAEQALGKPVANTSGIYKFGLCTNPEDDAECVAPGKYFIRSGITVFIPSYFAGLRLALQALGVTFYSQKVASLSELSSFDYTVVAAGSGIRAFPECQGIKVGFVKGQMVLCELKEPLTHSITDKKQLLITQDPLVAGYGSTYERAFTSEKPDLETAIKLLKPEFPVLGVRSGIRVTNPSYPFPKVERLRENLFVVTALGSRGLLYHALMGKKLRSLIDG